MISLTVEEKGDRLLRIIKLVGFVLTGIILFSVSMNLLMRFETKQDEDSSNLQFIKVKDGYFSYLDSKGYNLEFACEINQVLITETKQSISEDQIIIESENSFGKTVFLFDKVDEDNIKFTADHQGNLQRNYWFRMIILNEGLIHYPLKSVLTWNSGSFDYSDMQVESTFKIEKNDNEDFLISVYFNNQVDFYIDPILSKEIVMGSTTVFEEADVGGAIIDDDNITTLLHYDFNEQSSGTGNVTDISSYNRSVFEVFTDSSEFTDTSYNTAAQSSMRLEDESYLANTDDDAFETQSKTAGMWVKFEEFPQNGQDDIFQKQNHWEFSIQNNSNSGNVPKIKWWNPIYEGSWYVWSDELLLNQWYFIVGTFDNDSQLLKIYLNGVLNETQDTSPGGVWQEAMDKNITLGWLAANEYIAKFDDVFYSNVSYSATQILTLYENSPVPFADLNTTNIGNWTGYLVNASSQVIYNLDYEITSDILIDANGSLVEHNHFFYYPANYTLLNVTFGNGTIKTIESGFDLHSYNSTHNRMNFTEGIIITGNWSWFFLTSNALTYLSITPDLSTVVYNQTSLSYNIRAVNGSLGLVNYQVLLQIMSSDEVVHYSAIKYTGTNGWLNSSSSGFTLPFKSDYKFYLVVTGQNETRLGYITTYFRSYNDVEAPVIQQITFNDTLYADVSFTVDVIAADDHTALADLSVIMYYSFVTSGSLSEITGLNLVGGIYTASLIGQDVGVSLWFKIVVADNLSNAYESTVYQVDWIATPEPSAAQGGGSGDGGGIAVTPSAAATPDLAIILVFLSGAIMVAVLGYAVFKRVTVRTRKLETREVVTTLGGFGQSKEEIKEKGG